MDTASLSGHFCQQFTCPSPHYFFWVVFSTGKQEITSFRIVGKVFGQNLQNKAPYKLTLIVDSVL